MLKITWRAFKIHSAKVALTSMQLECVEVGARYLKQIWEEFLMRVVLHYTSKLSQISKWEERWKGGEERREREALILMCSWAGALLHLHPASCIPIKSCSVYEQWYCIGKCLTDGHQRKKPWLVVFPTLCGSNIPNMHGQFQVANTASLIVVLERDINNRL